MVEVENTSHLNIRFAQNQLTHMELQLNDVSFSRYLSFWETLISSQISNLQCVAEDPATAAVTIAKQLSSWNRHNLTKSNYQLDCTLVLATSLIITLIIYSKILKYFCSCGDDIKSTYSYILCGPQYSYDTITLINKIRDINKDILNQNNKLLAWALIFGNSELSRFTVLKS